MNPPPDWLPDEALVAKVIAERPGETPLKLGEVIVQTLREKHRLLLPPNDQRKEDNHGR